MFRGGVGGLSAEPAWTGEGGQNAALFGVSVAGAGDVNHDGFADIIVGASCFDNGETNEGRAVVFLGGPDGLGRLPQWSAEGNQGAAQFGWSVAGAGDVNGDGFADVVVGARNFTGTCSGGGRVSVYYGSLSGLGVKPAWSADGEEDGAHLGWSVASAGDVNGDGCADLVVGAPHLDLDGADVGGACILYGNPLGMAIVSNWTFEGGQDGAELGLALTGVGDVNGDGFDDVLVAAPGFDSGEADEGRVFLFYGSEDGLETRAAWSAEGDRSGAWFGAAVSGAGDINVDGYADVAVGAPGFSGDRPGEGRVFVFAGSPEGLSLEAIWMASGSQAGAQFGASVAATDVNGDRYGDLVVGAPGFDVSAGDEGLVQVFQGSAAGLEPTSTWSVAGKGGGARFGGMVASAGDTDGDGYCDVAIAAPGTGGREQRSGLVSVFRGSASGLATAPVWTVRGEDAQTHLGLAIAGAGDVDRDGYADLILGVPGFDGTEVDEGAAFLFRGSPSGLSAEPAWTTAGGYAGAWFGSSAAAAGDLDGDGYTDILVGAPALPRAHGRAGGALVFQGCSSGLRQEPAWVGEGTTAGDRFGAAVAGAGDINRDGFPDVLVGAPGFDGTSVDEGRAHAFHGSALGLAGGSGDLAAGVHTLGRPLPAGAWRAPAMPMETATASTRSPLSPSPSLRGRRDPGRSLDAVSRSCRAASLSSRRVREPGTVPPQESIGAAPLGSAQARCPARLLTNRREIAE